MPHLSKTYVLSTAVYGAAVLATAFLFTALGLNGMLGASCMLVLLFIRHLISLAALNRQCRTVYGEANENTAYKYYYRMSSNFYIAYDIFTYCAFITLVMHYSDNPWISLAAIAIFAVFTIVVTFLLYFLIVRKLNARYDDPSMFASGVLVWITTALLTYFKVIHSLWLSLVLFCFAFCIMISILNNLHSNMKMLLGYVADKDPEVMDTFDKRSICVGQAYSTAILIILTVSATLANISEEIFYDSMLLAPLIFLVSAYFAAVVEPMDDTLAKRLHLFAERKDRNEDVGAFKKALTRYLTNERKKFGVRVIAWIIKPYFRCKAENVESVDESKGPVVFVSNHLEIYGPIVCVLHLPFFFRPWIINKMLEPEKVEAQLRPGINRMFGWVPVKIRKKLPGIFKNIVLYVLKSMRPIPVYRDGVREVIETFNNTVKALEQDDNILLFPEKKSYESEGVSQLYTGFAQIGNLYYRETGKQITFYPIYISRKNQKMRIGPSVTFDPSRPKAEEKQRIADALFDAMHSMSIDLETKRNRKKES
ncbi:MAG: hypothetical protein LKK19_03545 [Bacteroidales bacterium]|nr:hypothetical protein [Bacteroidales bacterium]MCI2121760.1 hypothetical protein [Bacteroidales bacterium]MCI2145901.1 hypothetical protein [Bacteroidales bacterium]